MEHLDFGLKDFVSSMRRCMQLWLHFGLSHLLRECEPRLDSPPDSRYLREGWEQLLRRNMRIHVLTLAYILAYLNEIIQVQRTQPDYIRERDTPAYLTEIQCTKPKNMLQTRVQPQHKDAGLTGLHWLVPAMANTWSRAKAANHPSWFSSERSSLPPRP